MTLTAKLANPPERKFNGTECSVCGLLERLPPAESEALAEMLRLVGEWPANLIYDALTDEGHVVGRQSIARHRRRACRGFKGSAK